jgi:DNA helicase-2/ATP-dependent DNA helicase PcrA
MNEQDEASHVAEQILEDKSAGRSWKDHAVLYRMNAQSNQLEYAFKRSGIPYKVVGGMKFFDRAEVKDMLAYLCVVNNPADDLRLRRIINNPPRGIGAKTIETVTDLAAEQGLPLFEVVRNCQDYEALQKAAPKLMAFVQLIEGLQGKAEELELTDFYAEALKDTGYAAALEAKNTTEGRTRLENVQELSSSLQGYLENSPEGDLAGFLDEVALYTDLDSVDEEQDSVTIMTMHAAKGLEFPVVFVVGVEDGIFPGIRAIGDQEELEEERRLCYVAMTRAKEELYLSHAQQRMLFGHTSSNRISRFVQEIPEEYLERSERSLTEEDREYGGRWRGGTGGRARYGSTAAGRSVYSRQRPPRQDDGKPMGGGISVNHKAAPTGVQAYTAQFNLLSQYRKGDMIRHTVFGMGMIVSILPMGGDALVEIAFDGVGTKRLMLKAASQHMEKVEQEKAE